MSLYDPGIQRNKFHQAGMNLFLKRHYDCFVWFLFFSNLQIYRFIIKRQLLARYLPFVEIKSFQSHYSHGKLGLCSFFTQVNRDNLFLIVDNVLLEAHESFSAFGRSNAAFQPQQRYDDGVVFMLQPKQRSLSKQ